MKLIYSYFIIIFIFICFNVQQSISRTVGNHEKNLLADLLPSINPSFTSVKTTSIDSESIIDVSPKFMTSDNDVILSWIDRLGIQEYMDNMIKEDEPGLVIRGQFWGWMPVSVVLDKCMGVGCFWGTKGMVISGIASGLQILICGTIGGHFQGDVYLNIAINSIYISDIEFYVNGFFLKKPESQRFLEQKSIMSQEEKNLIFANNFALMAIEKGFL